MPAPDSILRRSLAERKTETPIRRQFRESLRWHRVHAGWSQQTLADEVGVSQNFIAYLESPHADDTPDLDMLAALARAFAVKPAEFLRDLRPDQRREVQSTYRPTRRADFTARKRGRSRRAGRI